MDQTAATTGVIGAVVAALLWLAWACFSDTRHNHGFWVALLMPLVLILMPVVWMIFVLIKGSSFVVFVALGRRGDHEEFMRRLRIRSGILMLL